MADDSALAGGVAGQADADKQAEGCLWSQRGWWERPDPTEGMGWPCLVKQPPRKSDRGPGVLGMACKSARHCREAAKAVPAWGDRNEGHEGCKDCGKVVHADSWHRTLSESPLSQGQAVTHTRTGDDPHQHLQPWPGRALSHQCPPVPAWDPGIPRGRPWSPHVIFCPLPGITGWETPTPWCNLALLLQGWFYS